MQHISTVVVPSGGSSSITFMAVGDIPSEYTDLKLVLSLRSNRAASEDSAKLEFNGITTGYSGRFLRGDDANNVASLTLSNSILILYQNTANTTANTFSNAEVYIPNYRVAQNKSFSIDTVQENNGGAWRAIVAGLWSNTAAITSITITPNVGTLFAEFSSASLYGILAGSDGTTVVS